MAEAKITDSTDWLLIDFRDCDIFRKGRDCGKIKKSLIIGLWILDNSDGVEIDMSGSDSFIFQFDHVDEVNGNTSITSNQILHDAIEALI